MFNVMSRAASSSSGSHDGSRCSCDELRLWFSDPISRPGAKPGNAIAGIGELAAFQRQTPAPYALGEPCLRRSSSAMRLINAAAPIPRKLGPISALWNAVARQLGQLLPNFLKRQLWSAKTQDGSFSNQCNIVTPQDLEAGARFLASEYC